MDGNSYDKDEYSSYCYVPMSLKDPGAEQIRCIYYEERGKKIVHPIKEGFCGRDKEFHKVLLGEASFSGSMKQRYSNDMLIRGQSEIIDWVYDQEDDFIYTEFCVDDDDPGFPGVWSRHISITEESPFPSGSNFFQYDAITSQPPPRPPSLAASASFSGRKLIITVASANFGFMNKLHWQHFVGIRLVVILSWQQPRATAPQDGMGRGA
ncbi:hypothetical protein PR202_ga18218 [Eleusine coracana subsp. coracana]|uniref:Uncharacterized protein n=1 Tax=Eleusine coracana subsp. coracana TaxID=191504 RepID=A0AAV5CR81_ELECO|nr:hypothetical protein PR202_ga18218 [Eleusine coracana subsp. coracana]